MDSNLEAKLAKLTPEARARVEEALKASLEAEVTTEAGANTPSLKAQFSRGVFFSRSSSLDRELIEEATKMDDAKFTQFAERLAALRKIKG